MKAPTELRVVLRRQWANATQRETRLLGAPGAWPVIVSIGRPSPRLLRHDLDAVKRHIEAWRRVKIGEVLWESVRYRATAAPVEIPVSWKLNRPGEWIEAVGDSSLRQEFELLAALVEQSPPVFRPLFIRRRSLWLGKPVAEIAQAARLAMALTPGCAQGGPLRSLTVEGIDTKFLERHAQLVTTLMDVRFDGEVSRMGLESFLGALHEADHWLLVVDLDGSLLPFKKMRVRSSELLLSALPGTRLLIVENEACQHQLPIVPQTIAVLGAGFDLGWTEAPWLTTKAVAYWGDIDTWGLQFLARARTTMRQLDALLMTTEIYDQFSDSAVPELVVAGTDVPVGLVPHEQDLYRRLLSEQRGRLEQEFLPTSLIKSVVLEWNNR